MKMHAFGLIFLSVFSAGAAGAEPIQLTTKLDGPNKAYVGSWESQLRFAGFPGSWDNTVLVLGKDGNAMFKHCAGRASVTASNLSGSIISDVVVGAIGNGSLTLASSKFPYARQKSFRLDRAPYQEGGRWYLVIDGEKLRKLEAGETSDHATWQCPH